MYCGGLNKLIRDYANGGHQRWILVQQFGQPNEWNVSEVTDMSELFYNINNFNENISCWDTSKVTNMERMFARNPSFHGDIIANWNVSNVTNMKEMFKDSTSNPDITEWDVSNVKNMDRMFQNNWQFNWDISGWNTDSVTSHIDMFSGNNIPDQMKPTMLCLQNRNYFNRLYKITNRYE